MHAVWHSRSSPRRQAAAESDKNIDANVQKSVFSKTMLRLPGNKNLLSLWGRASRRGAEIAILPAQPEWILNG
jgi:hypothetical protein